MKGYLGFISATDAENIGLVGAGKIIGNTDSARQERARHRVSLSRADRIQQLQERARGRPVHAAVRNVVDAPGVLRECDVQECNGKRARRMESMWTRASTR